MSPDSLQLLSATLFAVALVHTFAAKQFEKLSHRYPRHEGLFHLLGEVEVVFGFWAIVVVLGMALLQGGSAALNYVESRNYVEPLFVFVVMVIAGSRPVLAPRYPSLLTDAPHHRFGGEEVWYIRPETDRWLPAPTPIRAVVVPRYAAGSETRLEELPRSEALQIMLQQSFSVPKHGSFGIGTLTDMLQDIQCYRLIVGDLDAAVARLVQLTDDAPAPA